MNTKPTRRKREDSGGPSRSAKRARRDPTLDQFVQCQTLFNAIKAARDDDGTLICDTFMRAPSRRTDPDYHNVIQKPIDMLRINQKINAEEYGALRELCDDIELLIKNALLFYKEGTSERDHAMKLRRIYEQEKLKVRQSSSKESTPKPSKAETPDVWRLENVLSAILEESDEQGRLLCPPFRVLPSRDKFPLYYDTIQNPIDLQTIAQRIREGAYAYWTDYVNDFKLLFRNAKQFNEPNSVIYDDAARLLSFAIKKIHEAKEMKRPSNKEIGKYRAAVHELLNQEYETEDDTSEDSDEEDQGDVDQQMKELYWAVRNFGEDRNLCEHFLVLPAKSCYPDYYDDISVPMSFYLVNKKLKQAQYEQIDDIVGDIHQIFCNAMSYNMPGSEIFENAKELEAALIKVVEDMKLDVKIELFKDPEENDAEDQMSVVSKASTSKKTPVRSRLKVEKELAASPGPSSPATPFLHSQRPSIGSEDGNSNDTVTTANTKKRSSKLPPSRLPGAAETRLQLIPKRSKRDPNGPRLKPGRKSFNELRERYKHKLLEVYRTLYDFRDTHGRQICQAFLYLPNQRDYPDYYVEIEQPIDMTTIRHRIENGDYKTSEEFMDDCRLLCRNARHYNRPDSQIYADANFLEQLAISTMLRLTNNTVLHSPPPSKPKRGLNSTVVDEESFGPNSSYTTTSSPKKSEKTNKLVLSAPQHHMLSILDSICNQQGENGRILSDRFKKLPSKQEYPEYYDVIKKPIDLNRIRQKIMNGQYDSLRIFLSELNLVFENACKFNEPDSEIYRDALYLQKELMDIRAELLEESAVPSVQVQVRRILTNLLVFVSTYSNGERVLADSFAEMADLCKKHALPAADTPFTLDQIKVNVDRGRYRRLDRFQDDLFQLFSQARRLSAPGQQLFEDAADLQRNYIDKRDEVCKTVLVSPASTYNEAMLRDEVELQTKEARRLQKQKDEKLEEDKEEGEADTKQNGEDKKPDEDVEEKKTMPEVEQVEKDGVVYKPTDYAYIMSTEANDSEARHILRIERITQDPDDHDSLIISGTWVYKPSETFHLATRKFYPNEVFLTEFTGNVTVDRLKGKCFVMFVDDYVLKKPAGFDESDVFVCDSKYLGRKLHFKRLIQWPYSKDPATASLEDREMELEIEKTNDAPKPAVDQDDEDEVEDERMKGLPVVLDVQRQEVALKRPATVARDEDATTDSQPASEPAEPERPSSCGVVYFEQICSAGHYYRHGDFVLVFNARKSNCDVMRVEKIWQTPDGDRYFSGPFFARPKEVVHEPSTRFYKREVILVEERERVELVERIQAKCAVLTVKQFETYRPTEIPECDVFVLDHKVSGDPRDPAKFMRYNSARSCRKIKQYNLSEAVPDDEIFYFKKPVTLEREMSSQVTKTDTSLTVDVQDLDNEDRHVSDQLDNPAAHKDVAWLASQPKLNAKSKSGYILFSAEIRKRIMNENPEAGFGEVSKIVGVEWKKLSDEQKRQYETRASFIAEERAKNDLLTPNSKVLQPGEIRVYVCRWHGCDYQFDHCDGLFEHVRVSHASADESKINEDNETHYVCLWMTCVKYRHNGKPFPSLPRLLRHVREKHMPSSNKVIQPSQRGKHFFHYIPTSEPSNNSTRDQSHGLFIHQPNGMQHPQAAPQKIALPVDASAPNSPLSNSNHSLPPQTPSHHGLPSTSAQAGTPHALHATPQAGGPPPQQVFVQAAPAPPGSTHQVVQVINGSSVAYLNATNTPYQVILNHGGAPGCLQPQPGQQIVVQHAVASSAAASAPQHIVVHGNGTQVSTLQPGQYTLHHAPGPAYAASAHPNGATPAAHHHHPYYPVGHGADARTTVVSAPPPKPEPLFVPAPNSIKVKRVLHSEAYYKYVESLNKQRLKMNGQERPPRLRPDQKRAALGWVGKDENAKLREDQLVKALWRLREDMLENVMGIKSADLNVGAL